MAGQIVNVSNNEAISEVALKCGDPFFKDFPRNIYSQAVYRAQRSVAKQYGIMDRIWSYKNINGESPIEIIPLNVNGIWKVDKSIEGFTVSYKLRKLEDILNSIDTRDNFYHIFYDANKYMLYYTNPDPKDTITVYYTSSIAGEEDYEPFDADGNPTAIPFLPNKYAEEVIRRAVRYIAELGLASFDAEKGEKYQRVYSVHSNDLDRFPERNLEKSRPWILIKPFRYP